MEQKPTPERIFSTLNAYQQTAALCGAIELDLFTAIAEGADTAPSAAARCKASERGTRILCDYLTVGGLLVKAGSRYSLAPDAAQFLDRRSRSYIGGAVGFLNHPSFTRHFSDIAAAVRNGGTVAEGGTVEPDHPLWVDFARSMAPLMVPPSEAIADLAAGGSEKLRVLDIAAGHGLFGIAIARRNPNAEITALDWRSILAVAEENARAAGVADRYHLLAGSAFEVEFGGPYDVVLLTNILHHFDAPACEGLLGKVHRALASGGRAVTLEFVPNADRVSPPAAAAFAMMMLGTTPAGDAYTFPEYDAMFRKAGFSRSEMRALEMSPEQVILSYK